MCRGRPAWVVVVGQRVAWCEDVAQTGFFETAQERKVAVCASVGFSMLQEGIESVSRADECYAEGGARVEAWIRRSQVCAVLYCYWGVRVGILFVAAQAHGALSPTHFQS